LAAFTIEPALAIWQGMKPRADVRARSNIPQYIKHRRGGGGDPILSNPGINSVARTRQTNLSVKRPNDKWARYSGKSYGDTSAMKIIVGALAAFLLGSVIFTTEAEARCWWNGYNHCRYYHSGWHHGYGYYHYRYYRNGYWYR
jgi:hypothetical protein